MQRARTTRRHDVLASSQDALLDIYWVLWWVCRLLYRLPRAWLMVLCGLP